MRYAIACLAVAAVFAGCGTPPAPKQPTGASPAAGGPVAEAGGGGAGKQMRPGTVAPGTKPAPATGHIAIKDIGCPVSTCIYHAGANAYFACQSGGAGTCFHFGPACTPDAACMYDAASRTYKQCAKPVEGACAAWGAACAPASKCMFNPADNLHHTCEDVRGGGCGRYGALCSP